MSQNIMTRVVDKIIFSQAFNKRKNKFIALIIFRKDVPFFDYVIFDQLKYAAAKGLNKEESTFLSELFSLELKFTTATLVKWYNDRFKSRFREISEITSKCIRVKILLIVQKQNVQFET